MHPRSESFIRSSFINASRKEVKDISFPDGLGEPTEADWQNLDFLGWRDPKLARRAYLVVPRLDADPAGVLLKQAEASPRSRAMCNWCRDVRLPNEVVFWNAKRVGEAGRRGDTVGALICRDFECSRNVRNDPPAPYDGYDVAAARQRRIDALRRSATGFVEALIAAQ